MACNFPVSCWRSIKGPNKATGKWPIVTNPSEGHPDMPVIRPCGKCIGCRLEYSRQKAVRIMHESQMHECSSFLTLTYSDEFLPYNDGAIVPTLTRGSKSEFTLFMKRLRKSLSPKTLRFYQCGEYGDLTQRPHHHAILFGFDFMDDRVFYTHTPEGNNLYTSTRLSKAWPYGAAYIAQVTFESSAYVASYSVKKLSGPLGKSQYEDLGRIPPYSTASNRPGIGFSWLKKWNADVYPRDQVYARGRMMKPPRYYDEVYARDNKFEDIAKNRKEFAEKNFDFVKWKNATNREFILNDKINKKNSKL